MDNTIVSLSAQGLVLVPIVMALVSLVKMYVDSYWSPLFALIFGVAGSLLIGGVTLLGSPWLGGIVVGLMAAGLYSGGAKLIQG